MKVESSGNAIEVQYFSGKMEIWGEFAFHGFEVEVVEGDSSAGYEFFFVEAFSGDLKLGSCEFLGDLVGL